MNLGRPNTPLPLKELRGTTRKDRVPHTPMQPSLLAHVPEPPDVLSDRGAAEWRVVCAELQTLGMLYTVDLSLVAAYCNEMSVYWEMEELLRKNGRVLAIKNEDGSMKYMQQVPQVAIGRNALITAMRLAAQFGFTPSARAKLSAPSAPTKDAFDEFLSQ